MTATPHRVEWTDAGVTVTSDNHETQWIAADWVRQQEHLGPGALDEGRAWLVPAYEPDGED